MLVFGSPNRGTEVSQGKAKGIIKTSLLIEQALKIDFL